VIEIKKSEEEPFDHPWEDAKIISIKTN